MGNIFKEDLNSFVNSRLYAEYVITNDQEYELLNDSLMGGTSFDYYCVHCRSVSTFKFEEWAHIDNQDFREEQNTHRKFERVARCCWDYEHYYTFYLKIHSDIVSETGQFHSYANICMSDTIQYCFLLDDEKYSELTKAIELGSQGVGIGSFVYLRRVLAYLLESGLLEENIKNTITTYDHQTFSKLSVKDKQGILSNLLPSLFDENKAIFSMLNSDIHELVEDECLEMFPIMKIIIELLLDQKLKKRKTEQAEKMIQAYLQNN